MAPRTHLSFVQKRALQTNQRENPELTQADLCRWALVEFGVRVARFTISRILSEEIPVTLNPIAKQQQKGRHAEVEKALFVFVLDTRSKDTLTDFILHQEANQLLEEAGVTTTLSLLWVSRFKARHGIKFYPLHFEAASVKLETLHRRRQEFRTLLDGCAACDVFNMDTTGLLYRMNASRALATMTMRGKKKYKSRISIGLCSNMDGTEKLDPIVINKSLNPRCFKAIYVSKLPVLIHANAKVWMTGDIFANWLKAFILKISGQKVLLLLDNATSHVNLELSNVPLDFLPPNTTSHLQPINAGIIRNFKLKFKAQFVQWLPDMVTAGTEDKKLDVLSAILMIVKLWAEMRPETIRHCWIHTGIVSGVMAAVLRRQDEPVRPNDLSILANLIDNLSFVM